MKDDNQNANSIIKSGNNGLVKVGNSIDVTRKLLSQGTVLEKKYSNVKVIPYKKKDGWYLFNKVTNTLYHRKYRHVNVNKQYTLCLDDHNLYWLYRDDILLFQFEDFKPREIDAFFIPGQFAADFEIIEQEYLAIYYCRGKSIEKFFIIDSNGNQIEHSIKINELIEIVNKDHYNEISINETFWEIKGDSLYFKQDLIFSSQEFEIVVSNFNSGYALVQEYVDYDDFAGHILNKIGYIDVYGNFFWE